MKYILEIYNTELASVLEDFEVGDIDASQFFDLFGCRTTERLGESYVLDDVDIVRIKTHFSFSQDYIGKEFEFVVRSKMWFDELSYKTHTNRELLLMLAGKKPLSVFSVDTSFDRSVPEVAFSPYVSSGRIHREENEQSFLRIQSKPTIKYVYFCDPSETWRIRAHILLMHIFSIEGWSNAFTRIEGALLGYKDSETDEYLQAISNLKR